MTDKRRGWYDKLQELAETRGISQEQIDEGVGDIIKRICKQEDLSEEQVKGMTWDSVINILFAECREILSSQLPTAEVSDLKKLFSELPDSPEKRKQQARLEQLLAQLRTGTLPLMFQNIMMLFELSGLDL